MAYTKGQYISAVKTRMKSITEITRYVPDEIVIEVNDVSLFPMWEPDINYPAQVALTYNGKFYRTSQTHKSQAIYPPGAGTESLYYEIKFTEEGVREWIQPTGGHDAYKVGDIVSHKGKIWISTNDANVWEPGVFGWEEQK